MASNIAVENAIAKLNNSTIRQNKIMIVLTVLSIVVAIFFGIRSQRAESKIGQINQNAKTIINANYFNEAPKEVRDAVITISTLSSDSAVLQK